VARLIGFRLAVPRRPAAQDVADVDVLAAQAAAGDDAVQHLPGRSDERLALPIFVGPGGLADEENLSPDRTDAEYSLGPRRRKLRAASTLADQVGKHCQFVQPMG
jgi:hypothetical protein